MSDFFPCPPPPREWQIPPEPTAAELYRRRIEREHGAEVDRMIANPIAMCAFRAHCRLLGGAASSSASRSEDAHLDARAGGTAVRPGPALMVGSGA